MNMLTTTTKITLISLLVFLFPNKVIAVTCKCSFNTTTYSAVAEGEGYCSSVTENGQHCSITFNGKVEKPATRIESSSTFGPINEYINQMETINAELNKPYYLARAQDDDWLIKNLPLMIRSGYAAVPFLIHQQREKLDFILSKFFKDSGKEVYGALMGKNEPISKKNVKVTKGEVHLSTDSILVDFIISIFDR
jgi:hypothetical protein